MNAFKQIITNAASIHKAVFLSIALLINASACMADQLPLDMTIHNVYSTIFNDKNPHSVLIIDKNKVDQARRQLPSLINFLPTLTKYINDNAFGDKALLNSLAEYKTTQTRLASTLSHYLSKLSNQDTKTALHDMLANIETLKPLKTKLNNTLQPLRNQNLFSSFFDRNKTQKRNAQKLLVDAVEQLNWAINTTQVWGENMTRSLPHVAQQQVIPVKASPAALQAEKDNRRAQQQKLVAIDQEKAHFEAQLTAYLRDQNSTLAGATKLAREYQLSQEVALDPSKAARYKNYTTGIMAAEKDKFNRDLGKYQRGDMTTQELRNRWATSQDDVSESIKQRSRNYQQQIEKALNLKSGIQQEHLDMDVR